MSGSLLAPWASQQKPLENAKNFAKSLLCPIDDTIEMITCLKVKKLLAINLKCLVLSYAPQR